MCGGGNVPNVPTPSQSADDAAAEASGVSQQASTENSQYVGPRGTKGIESRAWRNRNPGNLRIRSTKLPVDHAAVDNDPGGPFGIYASERDGWADLAARVIQIAENGGDTVEKIITIWAPPSENNTNVYIGAVCTRLGVVRGERINPRKYVVMDALSDAIRRHEGKVSDPDWNPAQREAGLRFGGAVE